MMKKYFAILYYLLFMLLPLTSVSAQQNCALSLRKAEKLYEDGQLQDIPQVLSRCLEYGFSREEKIRAYRLLILCNLFDDNYAEAEQNMLNLLRTDPEYELNPSVDNAEFSNLYKSYLTLPLYSITLLGGINASNAFIIQRYSVGNASLKSGAYERGGLGFHAGLNINRYLGKHIGINLGGWFMQNKFSFSDTMYSFSAVKFNESQTRLDIPVFVNADYRIKKFIPYAKAGLTLSYLFSASANIIREYTDNSHNDITSPTTDISEKRNEYSLWLDLGGGLKYKINRGFLVFDFRYNIALNQQVMEGTRYNNPELMYKYYYMDNDFKLNRLTYSVGYMYPFYKPKKIK